MGATTKPTRPLLGLLGLQAAVAALLAVGPDGAHRQVGARRGGAVRAQHRVGDVARDLRFAGGGVELEEARRAEAGVVGAAHQHLLDRHPLQGHLGVGGGAKVAVVVAAHSHRAFQALDDGHGHFGKHGLDVARDLGEFGVEGGQEHRLGAARAVAEGVAFLANVKAEGGRQGAGRQLHQLAGDAAVELDRGRLAVEQPGAGGAGRLQQRHAGGVLGAARGHPGVDQATGQGRIQGCGEQVALTQHRLRLALGRGQAQLVVPLAADHTLEAGQHAVGIGGGLDGAAAAVGTAPAVGDGLGLVEAGDEGRQVLVERPAHGVGRGQAGGDLVGLELLGGDRTRDHGLDEGGVVLVELEGATADEVGAFDGLDQHGRTAVVVGTGKACTGRCPQRRLVLRLPGDHIAVVLEAQQVGAVVGLRAGAGQGEGGADGGARQAGLRGELRAGGVGREAARGLEAVRERALGALELFLPVKGQAAHQVVAVTLHVAHAAEQRAAVDVAAALFRGVEEAGHLQAGVVLAQDEVDDAADGVGAVHGRGPVLEHLDALHRGQGDPVQVHRVALGAVGGDAPAVQQHQGARGSQAAQVGAGVAVVVAVGGAQLDADVGGEVVGAGAVGRDARHQLLGADDAGAVDLLAGDGLHGRGAFGLHPLDAGAGDLDPLQGAGLLCPHGRGNAQQCDGPHDRCQFHQPHSPCCARVPVAAAACSSSAPDPGRCRARFIRPTRARNNA